MFKIVKAYLYYQPGCKKMVVTDKRHLNVAGEKFFEEVVLAISSETIKQWCKEINLVDLD